MVVHSWDICDLNPGQFIEKFASLGAETSAIWNSDNRCAVKVKYPTINGQALQQIAFDYMLHTLDVADSAFVHYLDSIERNKRRMSFEQSEMVLW